MPLKSELQQIHEAVGELALEYERQYPSALDRTSRVCSWLRPVEPELFFSLVPYHKDARTVVARENGFRDWMELAAHYGEPDETLYSTLDDSQKAALGIGGSFRFAPGPEAESSIAICILWLCLTKQFHLAWSLAESAGPRVWNQNPSLLRRLIEADAPMKAISFCLSNEKAPDFDLCAKYAFRLGNDAVVEALRQVDDLPPLTDLDMLLEACSKLDEDEVEAWLFRVPGLWESDVLEVWRTASHWAALGRNDSLTLGLKTGLRHSGAESYWCSPLHHAAWNADYDVIETCFALGCPIHSQDRKYLSTPLGWLVRAQSFSQDGTSTMTGGSPTKAAKLLIEKGALLMPSHLFCPNKTMIDGLID